MKPLSIAAAALSACLGLNAVPVQAYGPGVSEIGLTAEDLLAPYYAKLPRRVSLPSIQTDAAVPIDTNMTRIAFGSCNHQSRSQAIWAQIAEKNPNVFLFIGDNNYGDQGWSGDPALSSLVRAYSDMASNQEFSAFYRSTPILATWDDHDYGFNDGGANFAFRAWSEEIFETFWNSSEEVKARPGVYDSHMFGEAGKRTQIIMLDTRFFRSDLERMEYTPQRPPLGPYVPSADAGKTMLGDAQWAWLSQELAKPADLRIVVSSIQVITDAHNYESWEALPLERSKLYAMLGGREDSGLVLLSGDRHGAGIYKELIGSESDNETVWELTSSSLNYSFSSTERNTAREPDDKRLTDFISEENFGAVDIDWKRKSFTMKLFGNKGEERASQTVKF